MTTYYLIYRYIRTMYTMYIIDITIVYLRYSIGVDVVK